MAILVDWVKQQTATTGTGTITLGSAVSGFIRFQDDTRLTDGAQVYYTIEDGTSRERGIGTYTASGTTLSRDVIHATLVSGIYTENPGSGLNLSGSAVVSCSAIANTHNFRGCRVGLSANYSLTSGSVYLIEWASASIDTDGFFSGASPTRITIPAGVSAVSIGTSTLIGLNSSGERTILMKYNGVDWLGGLSCPSTSINKVTSTFNIGYFPVSLGDYFEVQVYQNSGVSLDLEAGSRTWFALEVIE